MTDSGDTQSSDSTRQKTNFLREIIENDLASGRYDQIVTRFPPEPNGHLHIGHARNIYLNFHLPEIYGGRCHLRMDDTNPEKEKQEYVDNIIKDIRWLGFDWGDHFYLASNYFDRLYACAEALIEKGMAYVCFQSEEDMRESRGTVSEAGTPSPWRDTDPALNLERFRGMRDGQYADGECVLRGKIDMAAANMKLRDPPLYRIRRQTHQHTGDRWCIYPMYDFAHPLSDAFEHITHSICTLEFQDNRAIYDWLVEHCPVEATPHQYEVSRANLNYTVMSKRILARLVDENQVDGWDDPRMPTLSGFRRRGVRPEAIRTFCERSGISKSESTVEMDMLEHLIRDDLNHEAPRVMAVLNPLKVTITNWERDTDWIEGSLWPHDVPKDGVRPLPFSRNILIERTDFAEIPPKKWRRLAPGWEVRLRYGYVIRCDEVIRDGDEVVELRCSYDASTRGGNTDRKVKGTIHWVSADHALDAEVRLYERLFSTPFPGAKSEDLLSDVNPQSKQVIQAKVEQGTSLLQSAKEQLKWSLLK